jgi:hypothetical protein
MASFYLTASRGDQTTLCLSPLTDRQIATSGTDLADTSGHFLYERRGQDLDSINIIAQVFGDDAIQSMRMLLDLS